MRLTLDVNGETRDFDAAQVQGRRIETVESLAPAPDQPNPLQAALQKHHGLQCGFCTPGSRMSLTALFRLDQHPAEDRIREYIQRHLCRCTGYQQMVEAALEVSGGEEVATR